MKPEYDQEKADRLIGKYVIIGLTYLDSDGKLIEQKQLHGDIVKVSEKGIFIKLRNTGEEFSFPPHLEAFQIAHPGEYRFRSTGEVIVNPDLMTTWTITQPKQY